jgi:hypothetical protein
MSFNNPVDVLPLYCQKYCIYKILLQIQPTTALYCHLHKHDPDSDDDDDIFILFYKTHKKIKQQFSQPKLWDVVALHHVGCMPDFL